MLDGHVNLTRADWTLSDRHASCSEWAQREPSECTQNPDFMRKDCAGACALAGLLSRPLDKKSLASQIRQILRRDFGIDGELRVSAQREKEYAPTQEANWSQLHADYFESAAYVFSSVLMRTPRSG